MPPVKIDSGKDARQQDFEVKRHPNMAISWSRYIRIFVFYWLPVFLYCLLIFIQSSYPVTKILPSISHMDKLAHAGAYALLGFLFYRAFHRTRIQKNALTLVVLSVLASSIYGISDEIHQYFVPSRMADIADVAANTVGSIMGAIAAQMSLNRQ